MCIKSERKSKRDAMAGVLLKPAASPAPVLDARGLMRLQSSAGNRAVQRLLATRGASPRALHRVTTGATLDADKAYARQVINPLLDQYFVGQDLTRIDKVKRAAREQEILLGFTKGKELVSDPYMNALDVAKKVAALVFDLEDAPLKEAYKEGMKISKGLDAEAVERFGPEFLSKLDYWSEKARRVRDDRKARFEGYVPLWCDHATALVIDLLATDSSFTSSLDVVMQGDPKSNGHWYVLANREGVIEYGRELTENEFVIDLWGSLRLGLTTTVHDSGPLHLFQIEDLEGVMSVPEKEELDADTLLDDLLAGLAADKEARAAVPASTVNTDGDD
jgi:hypothetical protein